MLTAENLFNYFNWEFLSAAKICIHYSKHKGTTEREYCHFVCVNAKKS